MAGKYPATAAALPADRYQARPARRKKKPSCLPVVLAYVVTAAVMGFIGGVGLYAAGSNPTTTQLDWIFHIAYLAAVPAGLIAWLLASIRKAADK